MPIVDGVMTIAPKDIKITRHLFDAFGHYETETSARWLVEFAQMRGKGWKPFTYDEIEAFYESGSYRNFCFNNLITGGFIVKNPSLKNPVYHFTEVFITRCYKAAAEGTNA